MIIKKSTSYLVQKDPTYSEAGLLNPHKFVLTVVRRLEKKLLSLTGANN